MSFLFALCNKLDLSIINHWDTSKVTDMTFMFSGCYNNLNNFGFESINENKNESDRISPFLGLTFKINDANNMNKCFCDLKQIMQFI